MRTHHTSADLLRHELVDRLVDEGTVHTAAVERAMRAIPRELFVPDLDVWRAYEDRPQRVKSSGAQTLSTISQPTMIAIMLELAGLESGERVLEIGTGSGYNAALLAELVGSHGRVVTVDVEVDLVATATQRLAGLGLDQVQALVADGRSGWAPGAPYDCIMATVGVPSVPAAWRDQLADGGCLLAPLLGERLLVVERRVGSRFVTEATSPAAFIPLR